MILQKVSFLSWKWALYSRVSSVLEKCRAAKICWITWSGTVRSGQRFPSLTMLFNKSLRLGIFSEEWKLANIVPIFKKGKRDLVENYRPISPLPVISKVLLRYVLAGLRDHISHLFSHKRHGFLAARSLSGTMSSEYRRVETKGIGRLFYRWSCNIQCQN